MRRFAIILVLLAVLVVGLPVRAQVAADVPPLYRQFRVLSGLPWKELGATRETVLVRIFDEPHTLVRNEVLREYLQTALRVEEFSDAFDECIELEQADFPGAAPEFVMRAWAERDPAAALKRCETLFDMVIEGAPLEFDTWKKVVRVGNLEKARASSYWFGSRGVVHACWKGLEAAALPPERRKELEAEFIAAYTRRFQDGPPEDVEEPARKWGRRYRSSYVENPPTISTDAEMRGQLFRLLAARPEEIPRMFKWPREPWSDVLFSRALIRWMNGDAKKAPQIVERVLDAYDPRRFYGDVAPDVFPAEFLMEWAILDRDGFMIWASDNSRLGAWRAQAVYLTVMPKKNEYEVQTKALALHVKELETECHKLWITLDPHSAILRLSQYDKHRNIEDAVDNVWRSDPPANYWRAFVRPFVDLNRRGGANEAWGVTTVWGPVDFKAMVKQYGLPWCLNGGEFKEPQMARMLSNRREMENDSGLRNTLSALRTWAILRPKELRAWIESEKFRPDLHEALLWLLDNATDGAAAPGR